MLQQLERDDQSVVSGISLDDCHYTSGDVLDGSPLTCKILRIEIVV